MLNAIALYRIARWLWLHHVPVLPSAIKFVIFVIYNSVLPYQCVIGPGSHLAYGGVGVIIHKNARLGKDVTIGSGVTIGGRGGTKRVPQVGNHVYLATGSKILGDVHLGDFVFVGANAVVISSIPSYSVAAGVPAKILRTGITKEQFRNL